MSRLERARRIAASRGEYLEESPGWVLFWSAEQLASISLDGMPAPRKWAPFEARGVRERLQLNWVRG